MACKKRNITPELPMGANFPFALLGEAWVPYQRLGMIFDPATGLLNGTIFPELVRPYQPHPNSPGWYGS